MLLLGGVLVLEQHLCVCCAASTLCRERPECCEEYVITNVPCTLCAPPGIRTPMRQALQCIWQHVGAWQRLGCLQVLETIAHGRTQSCPDCGAPDAQSNTF